MPAINSPRMGIKMANGLKNYITWEFLANHPRTMESGYFHVDWNTISGLYNKKSYLRTLIIERQEWDYLSDPAQLRHYWEPTDNPDDFHRTLGLAWCWTPFHDCSEPGRKKEYVVSVAVIRKLARHQGLPFIAAIGELHWDAERTPKLLLVRLHRKSLLFPDIYYDRCGTHFTLMHDTGKGYNMGDPQKFLGALLQNLGRNHTIRPNKPPGYSGRTMQGERKMQRHVNWKRSARRSPLGSCFL